MMATTTSRPACAAARKMAGGGGKHRANSRRRWQTSPDTSYCRHRSHSTRPCSARQDWHWHCHWQSLCSGRRRASQKLANLNVPRQPHDSAAPQITLPGHCHTAHLRRGRLDNTAGAAAADARSERVARRHAPRVKRPCAAAGVRVVGLAARTSRRTRNCGRGEPAIATRGSRAMRTAFIHHAPAARGRALSHVPAVDASRELCTLAHGHSCRVVVRTQCGQDGASSLPNSAARVAHWHHHWYACAMVRLAMSAAPPVLARSACVPLAAAA